MRGPKPPSIEDTEPVSVQRRSIGVGVVIVLAGLLLITSCSQSADDQSGAVDGTRSIERNGYTVSWTFGACPGDVQLPTGTKCGTMTVPENRAKPNGKQLRLAAAILSSKVTEPKADPGVYLSGGPGSNGLAGAGFFEGSPILDDREVILFGQRGSVESDPNLACPEADRVVLDNLAYVQYLTGTGSDATDFLSKLGDCRERLVDAGNDLSQYSSRSSSADVDDLRSVLGYEKVNLVAVSYGTRLALEVLRNHPEGIRSAVLDSVYPPGVDIYGLYAENGKMAISRMFQACVESESCNSAYPDLENRWEELLRALAESPVSETIENPYTQAPVELQWDPGRVVNTVFNELYEGDIVPTIPGAIDAATRGDFSQITDMYTDGFALFSGGSFSRGMNLSIQCRERAPFAEPSTLQRRGSLVEDSLVASVNATLTVCALWDVPPADPRDNDAVSSDLPVLILTGEFDPITPPSLARNILSTLSDATFYELPGLGHGVSPNPCAARLEADFLADPTQPRLSDCVTEMGEPAWVLP